ncbi:hypothetical protein SAMN05518669_10122 [Variovorax sp. YR634]|nr:hypothetical protein SAMN05518669_10122 [Variovorax sp. YR634]
MFLPCESLLPMLGGKRCNLPIWMASVKAHRQMQSAIAALDRVRHAQVPCQRRTQLALPRPESRRTRPR